MKTMTCKQLGGACDEAFRAETFDEIAQLSKRHGTEQYQLQEPGHLQAMQKMMAMMGEPGAMEAWMSERRNAFDALPDDE
jgi:hypothetical protein